MGRSESKPTIRILILGAPGVGKNCLESRFTTTTYPPPYDPALTLHSRRYFTLSPRPSSPPEPTTRPLDTSYGLPTLRQTSFAGDFLTTDDKPADDDGDTRPHTASSTFSNPASASLPTRSTGHPTPKGAAPSTTVSRTGAIDLEHHHHHHPCPECKTEATTYLVELTNHPALQLDSVRAAVLGGGEYDAVVLVYDVGSRGSFDAVAGLAGEVVGVFGRGGGKGGRGKLKRRRSGVAGVTPMSFHKSGQKRGYGEPVVALVGNKADFDAEYASVDVGFEDKRAALEEVGVEERGLVHPLYRESQLYRGDDEVDGGDGGIGVAIGLPELRSMIAAKRGTARRGADAASTRPLLSPYSGRSFAWDGAVQGERSPGAGGNMSEVEEWPLTRKMGENKDIKSDQQDVEQVFSKFNPSTTTRTHTRSANLDSVVRRSAMSADHHLLSSNNRTSILSKRSVRTMQEGSKPLVLAKLPKSEAVENWIRTGSPTTAEHPDDESRSLNNDGDPDDGNEHHDRTRDSIDGRLGRSYSTTTTAAAPRRQVSRLEGEMLARTLVLGVPFYETSAKTGENVEDVFEAVVRAVLGGRGALPDESAVLAECRRKHGEILSRKTVEETGMASENGPEVILSESSVGNIETLAIHAESLDGVVDAEEDGPVAVQIVHRRRRESMLDRFRKVFSRRSAVPVEDVAG
ncbi:hypothetical protein CONLIGDRAFT_372136 [Coniochaeta ligniaria NRRL 30616]|uniref:Ras-domain-containing protein n=1 Tax=Coniochaeta ligniaria NRRL 30616 TaxID=1408157 RepID=A0A1J7JF32_9PEZI|nr:hypothetical protein CONLIGDRAFT_372136 [Coniochaeta ligniaria NRRL 30616]